ncbi:MAG: hypothetical protein KDD42_02220 [Bdellovibrionales bacterium]|nr:hypothetical protein [Bdellovibrionales bacterium]
MELNKLIEMAEEALADNADLDRQIAQLEGYSAAFVEWFETRSDSLASELSQPELERLARLAELHDAVLQRAQGLKVESSNSIRKFKAHAKGLMKYVDAFPHRISTRRTRKG